MPQFQETMTLSQFMPPLICFGMLLMGLLIFSFIYSFVRDRLYLTMSVLAFAGTAFVFCESMILLVGGWLGNPTLGMQFHRLEQVAGALFLFAIPYMLGSQLVIGPRWRKANGLSQTNAQRIQMITESSRSLVDMVNALRREIEEFNLNNTAVSNAPARKSERGG